ncbi:MAG: sulfatase [Myxococcota bacterium]
MNARRKFGRLLFSASLCIAVSASAAERPNIVLITIDTLRADHCSAYGYANETTPALQRLASAGARFETAYAPTSETAPSHASIFTGLYPVSHGLIKNGLSLSQEHETLAETLLANGYQTAAFVSSFVLKGKFGWSQGFSSYRDDFDASGATTKFESWEGHRVDEAFDQRGDVTTRAVTRWLWERDRDRPFFVFVHYFDPHSPYEPPIEFEQKFELPAPGEVGSVRARADWRRLVRRYDGEIAFVDQEIGRLLDVLDREGLSDGTLVVVTADHGEGLMDHRFMLHGIDVYQESVLVPLLFRWPEKIAAGQLHSAPVELVDLVPTILDLAGVEARSDLASPDEPAASSRGRPGHSLAAAMRDGASLDSERPVFVYRRPFPDTYVEGIHVNGDLYGIRVGKWKLIVGEKEHRRELYDLERDRDESNNVVAENPDVAAALEGRLERFKQQYRASDAVPRVSEQDRKGLEALGYTVE